MYQKMVRKVTVLAVRDVTHDVKSFIVSKPNNFKFTPGQATDVRINKPKWKKEKRPFTFTCLNEDKVLELTIKGYPIKKYPDRRGVTEQIHKLKPGDELLLSDPWGTISYQGPGLFIAGGAGVTPFIAILRKLSKEGKIKGNSLIFSNKKKRDIIREQELLSIFEKYPQRLILTLTQEKVAGYENKRIDKKFLKDHVKNFNQHFYICGPKAMVKDIRKNLEELGVKSNLVVFEK